MATRTRKKAASTKKKTSSRKKAKVPPAFLANIEKMRQGKIGKRKSSKKRTGRKKAAK